MRVTIEQADDEPRIRDLESAPVTRTLVVGVAALAGVVAIAIVLAGCGSKKIVLPPPVPSNPKPSETGSTQCPPVKGATWVYPANVRMSTAVNRT